MTLPDGTISEITIGENEPRRIINFDETDHTFTTKNEKGGSQYIRWGDPTLSKGSECGTQGLRHTTGIYGTNSVGEAILPIYCYNSSARDEENFQIKPSWDKGGCTTVETYDSFAYIRKSGCTHEQLMQKIIEDVYLLLYPNCHKVVKHDNNGKLLAGPVFLKT